MGVVDTFSKRKRRAEQSGPDVYQYDNLPVAFRNQVLHILADTLNKFHDYNEDWGPTQPCPQNNIWYDIHNQLARERGVMQLCETSRTPDFKLRDYFLDTETDFALDVIELSFRAIDTAVRRMDDYTRREAGMRQSPDEAIDELNARFREHKIGYEFCGGMIHKVDSQYIHSQVVVPALQLLQDEHFEGAEEEFQSAHQHYRDEKHKEAVVDALKAFESTMKTIADRLEWDYSPRAAAKDLIDVMFSKGLFPPYLQAQVGSLRSLMVSGVPTVRNKTSAHGQGETPGDVTGEIAAYAMHLAAANIVLLVRSYRRLAKTPR